MDPVSAIAAALIAGATAAATDTASQAIKDAYQGLKTLLVDGYKMASAALLEKKPSHPAYQQAVEEELKDNPRLAEDKAVLEKAKAVQDALALAPPAQLAAWGVDIKKVEAVGSFIAERIAGTSGGLRIEELKTGGDVKLSDIVGGAPPGKS